MLRISVHGRFMVSYISVSERVEWSSGCVLIGCSCEFRLFDELLVVVRAGEGWMMVLRGELGVGKLVFLEYLVMRVMGC